MKNVECGNREWMKLEEMEVEPYRLEVDNAGKTTLNAYNDGNGPEYLE